MLENGLAAAFAKEDLVADKHVNRTQLAGFDFGNEPVGLGESSHQKPSILRNPPYLEPLEYIADQSPGKFARQSLQRRRIFFEETRKLTRDLILLAKQVGRILVENLTVAVSQRNPRGNDH